MHIKEVKLQGSPPAKETNSRNRESALAVYMSMPSANEQQCQDKPVHSFLLLH